MPCPKCDQPNNPDVHRDCVFELLKEGAIKNMSDWNKLWEPPTKILGKKKVKLPKKKD
jgi:hypothetical protein